MATLVAIGYPDQGTAEQARETVYQLETELIIQADQVAAISRDLEGKYHVHTTHGGASSGGGAVWGGFWGFLFGLLFFIPFAGMALGAGMGAFNWSRVLRHEFTHSINLIDEYDGDAPCRLLQDRGGRVGIRHDDVGSERHQFGCVLAQAISIGLAPSIVDP